MNSPLLTIRNLSVSFESAFGRRRALDGISLDIRVGDWIMIRGRNGAGKSTLLNTIMGLTTVETGLLTFKDNKAYKWHPFMVSQEPGAALPVGLTLSECLRLVQHNVKAEDTEAAGKTVRLLEALQLEGHIEHSVDQLSGGQRQMAAILMAALVDAPIVLLDEPTASLDPQNEAECLSALEMFDLRARAILHVTHNADHFHRYGNRHCEIVGGRIFELDSTKTTVLAATDVVIS